MNRCLPGVFAEVCTPLFYGLKHPVLCLSPPLKTINLPLTLSQWTARATIPSAQADREKIMDIIAIIVCTGSNNKPSSLFYPSYKKNSFLFCFTFTSLLLVMSHLLSFMYCAACQGRLEAGARASTAIAQYQYCDG